MRKTFSAFLYLPDYSFCPTNLRLAIESPLSSRTPYPSTTFTSLPTFIVYLITLLGIALFANGVILLSIVYRDSRTSSGPTLLLLLAGALREFMSLWTHSYILSEPGRMHDTTITFFGIVFALVEVVGLAWAIVHQLVHRVRRQPLGERAQRVFRAVPTLIGGVAGGFLVLAWFLEAHHTAVTGLLITFTVLLVALKVFTGYIAYKMASYQLRTQSKIPRIYFAYYTSIAIFLLFVWPDFIEAFILRGCIGWLAVSDLANIFTICALVLMLWFVLHEFRRTSGELSWYAVTQLYLA